MTNFQHLMDNANYTQADLALKIDVSQVTVSTWKYGALPSGVNLMKLSKALGVPPDIVLEAIKNSGKNKKKAPQ